MIPREFKVFDLGRNDSDKGYVVMSREDMHGILAAKGGRDVMIDLEHLSLPGGPEYDPDARGWGRLEARSDGLYLVDIKWTEDGRRRLQDKLQRYISPAFDVDDKGHVTEVLNIALTALPAMRDLSALVAASRVTTTKRANTMDPKLLEMLGLSPEAGLDEVMAAIAEMQRMAADAASDAGAEATADAAEDAAELADAAAASASEEVEEMAEGVEEMANDEADEEMSADALLTRLASMLEGKQAASAATRPMATELVKLSRRVEQIDRRDLMQKYGSRMTPALRKWCATQPIDVVRTFATNLPATGIMPSAEAQRPSAAPKKKWTAADENVARLTGRKVEDIAAHREKMAARKETA